MSIFRRPSGRWAVMIDADPSTPYRIVEPAREIDGKKRQARIVAKFRTRTEAEKALAQRVKSGDTRILVIEKLARGRRTLGTFDTKRDAERAERTELAAKDRGIDVDPTKLTMDAIFEKFIESREAIGKSGTTIHGYRTYWEHYCKDAIGTTLARKLSKFQLVSLYADLRRSGGRDGSALSAKTVRHAHGLIHSMLQWAMRLEMLERNVASNLGDDDLPRLEKREALAHEPSAIAKLLENEEGSRDWPFIAFAVATGMRRGELAALRWDDVDLDAREIVVRLSFAQVPGRVWLKAPKSGEARRIDLPELAMQALRRQRVLQAAQKLRAGGYFADEGYVFTPAAGGSYTPHSIYRVFARAAKRAGLELTKLHAARHSYASWLLASGVDIAVVSKLLGHSEITTTLRTYAHTIPGAAKEAVRGIDAQLAKAQGTRMARAADAEAEKAR